MSKSIFSINVVLYISYSNFYRENVPIFWSKNNLDLCSYGKLLFLFYIFLILISIEKTFKICKAYLIGLDYKEIERDREWKRERERERERERDSKREKINR